MRKVHDPRPGRPQGRSRASRPAGFLSLCATLLYVTLAPSTATAQDVEQRLSVLESQRIIYLNARAALEARRTEEYQTLLQELGDYPLRSYLEYAELTPRLAGLARPGGNTADIDRFLGLYPDTYLTNRLERTWVDLLARQERWADVLRYHNPNNTTTELTCHALHAQLLTGDTSAMSSVAPLWNVARSQPNACDPVFARWIEAGMLTPDIAWERFSKTIKAGQNSLASYISRLLPAHEQTLAQLYLRVDRDPTALRDQSAFAEQIPEIREMVLYGLQQLAVNNGNQAMALLQDYDARHAFPAEEKRTLQRYIAQRLLLQGYIAETETLLQNSPELISETLASWILRDALKKQQWSRIETWLDLLPPDVRDTERWQYWRTRALTQKGTAEALAEARTLQENLARTRSFYGFMAADQLGVDYELADQPILVTQEQMNALLSIPAIERAHELYFAGEEPNARNEWQHASANMTDAQIIASGKLADSWGWHRNGIQAMIRVSYWDDLQLRFPLAYADTFSSTANELSVSPHLLFAVARQESAFMHDVRSSAGALGLMQLMPATAQETATRAGMRISNQDLLRPEINIALGSRYLSGLLQNFNGNRILAAAAYNAGPNRVRQWLRQTSDTPVPLDIWIETIPFAETRNYVQNVLAYSVIYGYRMGEKVAMLTEDEASAAF
ncbi:MAG: transglycosylase SLT domain-containing protein [Gammaproteobacteria bacterium]|nr:transglycosylase SLT domain-containing protein [Gammaproteobacteria bacterium]